MKKDDAEEYTQSLGQIVAGSWRQIALAKKLGVPEALGLSVGDWVQERLGGYIKMSIPERQKAILELAKDGESTRGIAAIIGAGKSSVASDLVQNRTDSEEIKRESVQNRTAETMAVHYSSENPDWETPPVFFEKLNKEFHFEIDVCATQQTAKCENFFSLKEDGLSQKWIGSCWMNPPYGQEIGGWIEKAYQEGRQGALVVCLIPSRTDTIWWHDYVMKAAEIRFIRGRLKFVGSETSAPFPSALVVFSGQPTLKISAIKK